MTNTDFDADFAMSARRALKENPGLAQGRMIRAQARRDERVRDINWKLAFLGLVLGVLVSIGKQVAFASGLPTVILPH